MDRRSPGCMIGRTADGRFTGSRIATQDGRTISEMKNRGRSPDGGQEAQVPSMHWHMETWSWLGGAGRIPLDAWAQEREGRKPFVGRGTGEDRSQRDTDVGADRRRLLQEDEVPKKLNLAFF